MMLIRDLIKLSINGRGKFYTYDFWPCHAYRRVAYFVGAVMYRTPWKLVSCVYWSTMSVHLADGASVQWKNTENICHDDVIKWKHFPRFWPFVRGIHRSPVNSPPKGQWRGALMFSLIRARINGWVNNREAGNLRRHRAHYDVIVLGRVQRTYIIYRLAYSHSRESLCRIWINVDKCDLFIHFVLYYRLFAQ